MITGHMRVFFGIMYCTYICRITYRPGVGTKFGKLETTTSPFTKKLPKSLSVSVPPRVDPCPLAEDAASARPRVESAQHLTCQSERLAIIGCLRNGLLDLMRVDFVGA